MKKLIIIILALAGSIQAFAQQKSKTKNMTITIYEFHGIKIGGIPNMIITRDDSLQEQKNLDMNLHDKLKERYADHEQLLMNALKPYFDSGWRLVSASIETSVFQSETFDKYYRYYLTKDQ